jgi:hypothetical protein
MSWLIVSYPTETMRPYWRVRTGIAGETGMPHRPSSTDGHPSLFAPLLSVRPKTLTGLPAQDARRYASPYQVATARTVRH